MKTLIVVNTQNDFMKHGSLEISNANEIIPVINKLLPQYELIIFAMDWHPQNHKSFASQHPDKREFDVIDLNGIDQVLWPEHCIQNTYGSEIYKDINLDVCKNGLYIFKKGLDPECDSYSVFFDNKQKNSTGLIEFLESRGVDEVHVCGLAGDYDAKYTAIDSVMYGGFKTVYIIDAVRFIKDNSQTIKELTEANVKIVESWELPLFGLGGH